MFKKRRQFIAVVCGLGTIVAFHASDVSSLSLPTLSENLSSFRINITTPDPLLARALSVWTRYLEYAHDHDLPGITRLSHKLSATCLDPAREIECFALMDSVYAFASYIDTSRFRHSESDKHQIVIWTDYLDHAKAILYFTRERETLEPRVLSLRFCIEGDTEPEGCDPKTIRDDLDQDGYWDVVQTFF